MITEVFVISAFIVAYRQSSQDAAEQDIGWAQTQEIFFFFFFWVILHEHLNLGDEAGNGSSETLVIGRKSVQKVALCGEGVCCFMLCLKAEQAAGEWNHMHAHAYLHALTQSSTFLSSNVVAWPPYAKNHIGTKGASPRESCAFRDCTGENHWYIFLEGQKGCRNRTDCAV